MNVDCINYIQEVKSFVDWCNVNHLVLNVSKTKEMMQPDITIIKDKEVERVDTFKYLGVTLDYKLSWKKNTEAVVKKTKPRIYCLRKLRSFNVNRNLLHLFYSSIVSSTMTFGLLYWGGNLLRQDRERIEKLIKTAGEVVGKNQEDIMIQRERRILNKMKLILKDKTRPVNMLYGKQLSEHSDRYRVPNTRTDT